MHKYEKSINKKILKKIIPQRVADQKFEEDNN
jgi:hypothetical protein